MKDVPIYFYVPNEIWPDDITDQSGYFWSANRSGKWNWTIQTFQHLMDKGFECNLTKELPNEGIIIFHREVLKENFKPGKDQLLVCIQADHGRHPYAQFHILQNQVGLKAAQASFREEIVKKLIPFRQQSIFLKYWPQPGLISRLPERGDHFENVLYMGRAKNLAPELRSSSFEKEMGKIGVTWKIEEDRGKWVDYREIDAIIAVRDFNGQEHLNKPATKLYNAWHAGVPAILGPDSAFRAERKTPYDYIEVNSPEEILDAVRKLKTNPVFRQQMMENGKLRAQETTTSALANAWIQFFEEVASPTYLLWKRQPLWKQRLYLTVLSMLKLNR